MSSVRNWKGLKDHLRSEGGLTGYAVHASTLDLVGSRGDTIYPTALGATISGSGGGKMAQILSL